MNDPMIPQQPAQPAAPAAPDPSGERMDRVERSMAELTNAVNEAAQRLAPQAQPQRAPDDFLNDLASDPQGVIERVAARTFEKQAAQHLTPAVLQVLDTASTQILQGHRLRVDSEFGLGTFDEKFMPALKADIAQLRSVNPRAIADPATVEALVNRLYGGDNFQDLMDRKKGIETMHARGLSHLVPGGGAPRLRNPTGDELPPDVEQFIRETDRATGEQTDRKQFAKLYYTGVESGPGRHRTSVLDYLRATGADAETLKQYGGDRSA